MVQMLAGGECTVGELAEPFEMSLAADEIALFGTRRVSLDQQYRSDVGKRSGL